MNFTKLLTSPPPLPSPFLGKVVAEPLAALPMGGFASGPPPRAIDFPHTLRPLGATTPLTLTAKQATAVRELNLSSRGIEALPPLALAPFPQLAVLHLAHNKLTGLHHLGCCWRLRRLFASGNRVSSLAPEAGCELAALRFLEELDLSRNNLSHLNGVLDVLEGLTGLRTLSLAGCPCSNEALYRGRVLARLPFLEVLDSRPVGREEVAAAALAHGGEGAGAVRLAALRASALDAHNTARQSAAAAATKRGAPLRSPRMREDGVYEEGNETGRLGLGRGGGAPPPLALPLAAAMAVSPQRALC